MEVLSYVADAATFQWLICWNVELSPAGYADEKVFGRLHAHDLDESRLDIRETSNLGTTV